MAGKTKAAALRSHREVKSEILSHIRARRWMPGDIIPTEIELAQAYGCARATVNRALRELAEAGVVERKRKAGTRVLAAAPRNAQFEIPVVRVEILRSGAQYRYERLERALKVPPPDVAAMLGLDAGASALFVRCRHFADDRAHELEERWINIQTVPEAASEPFDTIGPNDWLVDNVPLTHARHAFTAEEASPAIARELGIKVASPVFVAERVTWMENRTITFVRLSHPGAHYRLVAETGPA